MGIDVSHLASRIGYSPVLSAGIVLAEYTSYLWPDRLLLWGQPAAVLTTIVTFATAGIIWLAEPRAQICYRLLQVFLLALGVAWIAHWMLYRLHGDAMNYTAALYVAILLMILLKPPNRGQIRTSILVFASTTAGALVLTRLLEAIGALQIKEQPQGVIQFDEARYFLPLNGLMGIDGRWPGPFGHNGDTAMMAALLIVISIAFWSRASWFFIPVGALTLILTNGRASIGAVIVGLLTIFMFTSNTKDARTPSRWRVLSGGSLLVFGAVVMTIRPAGLTGRERIWPAFLELWLESPWIGVGGSGFAKGNEITQQFGHAHSLYIEELARSGLVGFVAQFAALSIGVFIAARAAGIGYPGPLAVMAAYFVTGITEPRNNWIEPSATWFLLVLMVLAAAAQLTSHVWEKANDEKLDSLSGTTPAQ